MQTMILAFIIGYVFGLIFYALYFRFLLQRAQRTRKRPGVGWLILGRWLVMPVLVVLGAYLIFGDLNADCGVALAGYVASCAVRWVKVQMGMVPSNAEMLDAIVDLTHSSNNHVDDVASYMRQIKR